MTTPQHEQARTLADRTSQDSIRILIVGAGMAGLTLAALLQQRGLRPTMVERSDTVTATGYMLGLFPLGGDVLHGLGVHDLYCSRSQQMNHYEFRGGRGHIAKQYEIGPFVRQYGDYQGITRGALAQTLVDAMADARLALGTRVASIAQEETGVNVRFNDGSSGRFDLVVGADGLHSEMRDHILKPNEYTFWDTGWGGWVTWADPDIQPQNTYTECWGPGYFAGLYPVKGAVAGFLGGHRETLKTMGRNQFASQTGSKLSNGLTCGRALMNTVADEQDPFYWELKDCGCARWREGRVILLGDAADGFLPTAGVGASMAMHSAAALNDELSRTDAARVPMALQHFERRQRPRVKAAQKNSRQLARFMMLNSRSLCWLRDRSMRLYSLKRMLNEIADLMEG